MWLSRFKIFVLIMRLLAVCDQSFGENSIESRTKFIFYDNNNEETFVSTSPNDSLAVESTGCTPLQKYAIIVHGWRENCNTPWTKILRENLLLYRGGCIICMDYSAYNEDYGYLRRNFRKIAKILTDKLISLRDHSFRARTAYLFGFSYGARLITRASIDFGPGIIERIDLCEPAGPGFEKNNDDPKLAAQNSQCIHTAAGGYGTREQICHQDWWMGNCGESQLGARPYPNGNHGLCPQFYNSAFENNFFAIMKNETCRYAINSRDAIISTKNSLRMGYWQTINNDNNLLEKNFYAITTRDSPFNNNISETDE